MESTTSEWIVVKESSIHNKGVFASKDIPKETKIIEYVGRKITKKEADDVSDETLEKSKSNSEYGAVYLFTLDKDHDIDGNVSWNTARLMNHSCDPNCETEIINRKIWIVSSKDIKKGEEISYDYGFELDNYEDHICKCGAKNCIGYIVKKEHWIKIRKKLAKKRKKNKRKKLSN